MKTPNETYVIYDTENCKIVQVAFDEMDLKEACYQLNFNKNKELMKDFKGLSPMISYTITTLDKAIIDYHESRLPLRD